MTKDQERQIPVPLTDLRRLHTLLGHLNWLLHQPMHLEDKELLQMFATTHYPELRELFYKTVWDLLPEDIQREITEEDEE